MPCLINSQTLKMISQVESFLCPDKQGAPEEGRRIQWLKCCKKKNNKDEDNSPKILTDKNNEIFIIFTSISDTLAGFIKIMNTSIQHV